jgi:8-oxo-dGTP pyrophosphatase MutT (NUDIX family)
VAEKPVVKKVVAYIVWEDKVLVFRHRDFPEAGLQVPAGTIRDGETPEEAVLREAQEETGLARLSIVSFLGRQEYDIAPYRDEIQDRYVFHIGVSGTPPNEWMHYEHHDGLHQPTAFSFYWLPLTSPELDELVVGQGDLLRRLPAYAPPRD